MWNNFQFSFMNLFTRTKSHALISYLKVPEKMLFNPQEGNQIFFRALTF